MTSFSRNRQNRATFCSIVFSDQEFCLSSDFVSGEHDGTGGGTILVIPGFSRSRNRENLVRFCDFVSEERDNIGSGKFSEFLLFQLF